jgi:hypothetical protein
MKIFLQPKSLRIITPILVCMLVGCGSNPSDTSASTSPDPVFPALVIKTGVEDGHPPGIRLGIERTIDTDTTTAYKLISSYEGKPIGLIVVIPRQDNRKKTASLGLFKSLGAPSDFFLQVLAGQYKQHINSSAKFVDSVPFDCINLSDVYQGKTDSAKQETHVIAAEYKLFFDSDSKDGDAEMFMNINPDRQWVELAEKDEDYRPHLIRLFKRH